VNTWQPLPSRAFLFKGGVLALLYVLAGQPDLGTVALFSLPSGATAAALVWLPAGVGLAMILLLGFRGWPFLVLADLVLLLGSDLPPAVQMASMAGQLLASLLGAWLLQSTGFQLSLQRMRDVLGLVLLGALVSTLPASLLRGVLLQQYGLVSAGSLGGVVLVGWLAGLVGVLLAGTLVLVWHRRPGWTRLQWLEALGLWGSTLLVGGIVFTLLFPDALITPLKYLFVPLLIWAALRLQQHGVTVFTLLVSSMAVFHALQLAGTSLSSLATADLFYLYGFLLTLSLTGLVVAAIDHERQAATASLVHARDTLEAQVAQRTEALEAAVQRQEQELTERIAAETALQASERRFRTLVENAFEGITLFAADGTERYTSPGGERLLGRKLDETMGYHFLYNLHPDDHSLVTARFAELLVQPGSVVEHQHLRIRHQDGRWRWLETTTHNLLHDPAVAAIVVYWRDVTDRKETEAALHQQTRRLQVLRRIEQAILSVDSPQAVAAVVLDGLFQLISCYRISITLFDTERNELEWLAVRSITEGGITAGMRQPYTPSESVQQVGQGELLLIRDIEAELERTPLLDQMRQERIRTLVTMPLMRQGGPFLGTLNVLSQEPDAFSETHLELIREVAVPLSIALHQARLHQQVLAYSAALEQRVAERTLALDETVRQLEREVADRRAAEAALSERETRYRLVLNTVREGIFVMDANFHFQEANASTLRLFGMPSDQLDAWFAANAPMWLDGTPIPPGERPARKTLLTGLPCHEVVMGVPRPDKTLIWISLNSRPLLRDGETKPYAVVASFRDITDQIRAETALQQSEAQARLVFDTITEGLLVIDDQRQIIAWNASAHRILGLPANTLWTWVAAHPVVHEDMTPYVFTEQPSYKALRGEEVANQVMGYERPDGAFIWLMVNAKPLFQEGQSHPYAVVESFTDITGRRQQEAEIRSLNQDLRLRALELESANKELESFSYSVSHDLRAPLRAISGFAEILSQRYKDPLDATGKRYLGNIVEAATHMDRLIKDLLTYARLGRFAIERQGVDLSGVLEWVVQALQNRIQETGATLRIPPRMPVVPASTTLLEQVFLNLIENALKYTRPGIAPIVDVRCKVRKDAVLVTIQDNGEGIPKEYLEKIFRVFQRLHGADIHPGTGIGLAIVRKSITLLNGEVWAESKVGQGSTFHLRLPLQ
jgi:PAS domain S-box-containing protein